MKILKRIIYTLLGLVLLSVVAMVGVILYAEYSGSRFTTESIEALAKLDFSDGESRLVYDENGNIAELPGDISALDTTSADLNQPTESLPDTTAANDVSVISDAVADVSATGSGVSTSTAGSTELPYVMDLGSALFHTEDCPYAANIATENRSAMTTTREKIMNAGYSPCSRCNP